MPTSLTVCSHCLQVYKTQLERVSEGWKSRIGDFERVNTSLQTEVTKLQLENQDLKSKVRYEMASGRERQLTVVLTAVVMMMLMAQLTRHR